MNTRFCFAYCVLVLVAFGFLAGCIDARIPTVARCNHDEKQELINRLSKREVNVFTQEYVSKTTNRTQVGPIRISLRNVDAASDTLRSNKMACSSYGEEIIMNGKYYNCSYDDLISSMTGPSKARKSKYQVVEEIDRKIVKDLQNMISINQITGNLKADGNIYGGILEIPTAINYNNYDLFIYVTYRPDSWDVFATGTPLVFDQNGRTIIGLLNWNPRNVDAAVDSQLYYNVALHEIFHILGFSQSRMLNYHNASTLNETTGLSEEYSDLQLQGTFSDGREISLLTSPKVKEDFREQFGCPTAEGAVLEDQGGSNVAGSHWEMTVFMDELMTATVTSRSVLTNVTLSALEDSGWYYVNHENASHLSWGYKKGCDFVYNRCNSSWPVGDGYFCSYDKKGLEGCTYDRMGIGSCDFRFWVTIPEKYRYFNDEHVGGPVEYADYCPFTYGNFYCQDESTSAGGSSYGDAVGADSRCFMSTLTDSPDATQKQPEAPKCYPHHCISNESYAVKVGSYWYPCPSGDSVSKILSFTGSIQCADASLLCFNKEEDRRFPVFTSIEPTSALPGSSIRINGRNLYQNATITLGVLCGNVTAISPTAIGCTISESIELTVEPGLKNIIIKQNGYSIAIPNGFTLELSTTNWILKNWFLSACIAIAAVVLLLTLIIVICKCCSRGRKWRKYQESQGKANKKKKGDEFGADVEIDNMA